MKSWPVGIKPLGQDFVRGSYGRIGGESGAEKIVAAM